MQKGFTSGNPKSDLKQKDEKHGLNMETYKEIETKDSENCNTLINKYCDLYRQ